MLLKNKSIMILLAVLVLANIATITMYWLGRKKELSPLSQIGPPSNFLIKELAFDSSQAAKYLILVKAHQLQTNELREKTKIAKDKFFDLIKEPILNESIAQNNIAQISMLTGQQDMITLQHFRQVRALCNLQQQKKFDAIIHQMLGIMAQQHPNMRPPNGEGPPPFDGPPPPENLGTPPK